MALNLWKIGGKPTSYNPLPAGFVGVPIGMGEYVARIKAKSVSSASLYTLTDNGTDFLKTTVLTPVSQTIELSVSSKKAQTFWIQDSLAKGDIIIDSIELVQKPLPELTVNGVDGFTSGKWTLHPNAVVVDDETLVLNADGASQGNILDVPILPNTTYTFTVQNFGNTSNIRNSTYLAPDLVSFRSISDNTTTNTTFTTNATDRYFRIRFQNNTNPGQFTFKRPMLNLGSIPAPYSRKTGDKMVLPVAKKNLFDGMLAPGFLDAVTGSLSNSAVDVSSANFISVIPNKTYTLKRQDTGNIRRIVGYGLDKGRILNLFDGVINPYTFTIPSNVYYIKFNCNQTSDLALQVQLEEGTSATAYTPYSVQVNKLPQKWVPKKNLIPSFRDSKWTIRSETVITGDNSITHNFATASFWEDGITIDNIDPNKTYYFKGEGTGLYYVRSLSSTGGWLQDHLKYGNELAFKPNANASKISVGCTNGNGDGTTSIKNVTFSNLMLCEGTTATPYEPYQLVLPKARTGLSFNGVTDYLQLPSMTMDSVEIDCLIDSKTSSINNVVFHIGSTYYGRVANSSQNVTSTFVDGINSSSLLPYDKRMKLKYNFSPITGNTNVMSNNVGANNTKGILYKVTCYLNNQVVAQYDFENTSNIVGSTVLQNSKNLIPSFDDARWILHPNTQVLGKDLLRLNATGTFQTSSIILPIIGGKSYLFTIIKSSDRFQVIQRDINGVDLGVTQSFNNPSGNSGVISVLSNCTSVELRLYNSASNIFDFIKPQLYALDGTEGTLNGTPTASRKQSKRTLYAKR